MEKIPLISEQLELENIRDLIIGEPDVFLDLVGAMKYSPQKERYESGSFADVDENSKLSTGVALATGGKDRMLALAELHEAFPQARIVTMSKTRSNDEAVPTYAAMTRDELVRKGVPSEAILLEEESVSTVTEYIAAAKLWHEQQWKNMVFVSSNWHLPRCEALFNHMVTFSSLEDREVVQAFVTAIQAGELFVQFVGSTDVLTIKSEKYKRYFAAVDEDPGMLARITTEANALEQIARGEYGGKKLRGENKIWSDKL